MKNTEKLKIGNISIGGDSPLCLVAGPCVIESEKSALEIAGKLLKMSKRFGIPFVFKASYDKANRTSLDSYRGPGLEEGLEILKKIKKEFKIPIMTDVHCSEDVDSVSNAVDIVQIPAFLCRQTDLLVSVAKKSKCVNIKKGQFLAPWDMKYVVQKIEKSGNKNILLTERGTSFGYNRLVVDMCSLPIMSELGYPVLFDVTHSVQVPGGQGGKSGGDNNFIPYLAKAAVACGINGIFFEVHPDPKKALSDGPNSLKLADLPELLEVLIEIDKVVKEKW